MTTPRVLVEACVGSVDEAVAAEQGGAHRLELCDRLDVGGTTPDPDVIRAVKRHVRIPVAMMVRPRGGSFVFSDDEIDVMRRDLTMVRSLGADAVVIDLLDAADRVDVPRTRELVELAGTTPVTFHRAFDEIADRGAGLETLIDAGVSRVLTGGGPGTALDGIDALKRLVERAGRRVSIMAGGTVRGANVARVVQGSGVHEVHARSEADPRRIRDIVDALSSPRTGR